MMSVLEDKDAIRDLMTRYCLSIDAGRYADWVACFSEDGCFDSPILGTWRGPEKLLAFTSKYQEWTGDSQPRHCVMNILIDVDGDTASAESYLLLTHAGHGKTELVISGRYEDRLRKIGGEWRFTERKVWPDAPPAG